MFTIVLSGPAQTASQSQIRKTLARAREPVPEDFGDKATYDTAKNKWETMFGENGEYTLKDTNGDRAARVASSTADSEVAPYDWDVSLSQGLMYLSRRSLWVGDTDNDFHLPMLVHLREVAYKGWRKRSEEGASKRAEKKSQNLQRLKEEKAEKRRQGREERETGQYLSLIHI